MRTLIASELAAMVTTGIIGLILTILIIKAAFGYSFGKALLAWIF
jgi:hypothetical protein